MAGKGQVWCLIEPLSRCSPTAGGRCSKRSVRYLTRTAGRKWRQADWRHDFGALPRPGSITEHAAQHMDLAWYHLAQPRLHQHEAWHSGQKVVHSCGTTLTNLCHQLIQHILGCHFGNDRPAGTCSRGWKKVHGVESPKLVSHICHVEGKGLEMVWGQRKAGLAGVIRHAGKQGCSGDMCSCEGSIDPLAWPELNLQTSHAMISEAMIGSKPSHNLICHVTISNMISNQVTSHTKLSHAMMTHTIISHAIVNPTASSNMQQYSLWLIRAASYTILQLTLLPAISQQTRASAVHNMSASKNM